MTLLNDDILHRDAWPGDLKFSVNAAGLKANNSLSRRSGRVERSIVPFSGHEPGRKRVFEGAIQVRPELLKAFLRRPVKSDLQHLS